MCNVVCTQDTGAHIKVYTECAPMSTERIVQINGTPRVISKCYSTIFDIIQNVRLVILIYFIIISELGNCKLIQYFESTVCFTCILQYTAFIFTPLTAQKQSYVSLHSVIRSFCCSDCE